MESLGYDELNTRLQKFRDRQAAIPGSVEKLEAESKKINVWLTDSDLAPSQVLAHRKRLEEIASEIAIFGEDDEHCEVTIAELEEQFAKLDHSWATRSGIFRKRDQELAVVASQYLAFFLDTCEARKENASAWQTAAHEIGLEPSRVFGWSNVKREIEGLLSGVTRHFRLADAPPFGNIGRGFLKAVPELIDGKEAEAN